MGKGKSTSSPLKAILWLLRTKKKTEKYFWSSQSGGVGSLKNWGPKETTIRSFPSPHTSPPCYKCPCTPVYLTQHIRSRYWKKKIIRHITRCKAQSEETEQASELGMLELSDWEFKTTIIDVLSAPVIEVKWKSLSSVRLFVTPWTIQSMEFSRPEYWSG